MVLLILCLLAVPTLADPNRTNTRNPWQTYWANWGYGRNRNHQEAKPKTAKTEIAPENPNTNQDDVAMESGHLRGSSDNIIRPPGAIGSQDDPHFSDLSGYNTQLQTIINTFTNDCHHRRGCDSTKRILVRIKSRLQNVVDEYNTNGQITQHYDDASTLMAIPEFHDYLHRNVIRRKTFNRIWEQSTRGSGQVYAEALRGPPLHFTREQADFVLQVADDDSSGDLNRWELVDYLHAAGLITRLTGRRSYDVSSIDCWVGVYHDENRRMNSFLCP